MHHGLTAKWGVGLCVVGLCTVGVAVLAAQRSHVSGRVERTGRTRVPVVGTFTVPTGMVAMDFQLGTWTEGPFPADETPGARIWAWALCNADSGMIHYAWAHVRPFTSAESPRIEEAGRLQTTVLGPGSYTVVPRGGTNTAVSVSYRLAPAGTAGPTSDVGETCDPNPAGLAQAGTQGLLSPERDSQPVRGRPVSVGAPEYLGCWVDSNAPFDMGPYWTRAGGNSNSVDWCVAHCRSQGFRYAGLQYGVSCMCGDTYGSQGRASERECSYTCPGNASQQCGGYLRNSVYATGFSGGDQAVTAEESDPERWIAVLRDQLALLEQKIGSDYKRTSEMLVDTLEQSQSDWQTLPLASGVEQLVVGVCDVDCPDLDLHVYDDRGEVVAQDVQSDALPMVRIWPAPGRQYRARVDMVHCDEEPCFYGLQIFVATGSSAPMTTRREPDAGARTGPGSLTGSDAALDFTDSILYRNDGGVIRRAERHQWIGTGEYHGRLELRFEDPRWNEYSVRAAWLEVETTAHALVGQGTGLGVFAGDVRVGSVSSVAPQSKIRIDLSVAALPNQTPFTLELRPLGPGGAMVWVGPETPSRPRLHVLWGNRLTAR